MSRGEVGASHIWLKSEARNPKSRFPKSPKLRSGELPAHLISKTRLVYLAPSSVALFGNAPITANWLSPPALARSKSIVAFNEPELALSFASTFGSNSYVWLAAPHQLIQSEVSGLLVGSL